MILILFIFAFFYNAASADSLASIYNGQQFNLAGQTLAQDANNPQDLYVLPRAFSPVRHSVENPKTKALQTVYDVQHQVGTVSGKKYSIYTIHFELNAPSEDELFEASYLLRNQRAKAGIYETINIKGLAPICGMNVAFVGNSIDRFVDPDGNVFRYSFVPSPSGKCDGIISKTDFSLEIRVPFENEPLFAKQLMSKQGLALPPLDLILPYKYNDKVSVSINMQQLIEQTQDINGLVGTYKGVTSAIQSNMTKAIDRLHVFGGLTADCETSSDNPAHAVCSHFIESAQRLLEGLLFKITPCDRSCLASASVNIVGEINGAPKSGDGLYKVALAKDAGSWEKNHEYKIDFKNSMYSTIHSRAQVGISRLPIDVLAPEVRALVK